MNKNFLKIFLAGCCVLVEGGMGMKNSNNNFLFDDQTLKELRQIQPKQINEPLLQLSQLIKKLNDLSQENETEREQIYATISAAMFKLLALSNFDGAIDVYTYFSSFLRIINEINSDLLRTRLLNDFQNWFQQLRDVISNNQKSDVTQFIFDTPGSIKLHHDSYNEYINNTQKQIDQTASEAIIAINTDLLNNEIDQLKRKNAAEEQNLNERKNANERRLQSFETDQPQISTLQEQIEAEEKAPVRGTFQHVNQRNQKIKDLKAKKQEIEKRKTDYDQEEVRIKEDEAKFNELKKRREKLIEKLEQWKMELQENPFDLPSVFRAPLHLNPVEKNKDLSKQINQSIQQIKFYIDNTKDNSELEQEIVMKIMTNLQEIQSSYMEGRNNYEKDMSKTEKETEDYLSQFAPYLLFSSFAQKNIISFFLEFITVLSKQKNEEILKIATSSLIQILDIYCQMPRAAMPLIWSQISDLVSSFPHLIYQYKELWLTFLRGIQSLESKYQYTKFPTETQKFMRNIASYISNSLEEESEASTSSSHHPSKNLKISSSQTISTADNTAPLEDKTFIDNLIANGNRSNSFGKIFQFILPNTPLMELQKVMNVLLYIADAGETLLANVSPIIKSAFAVMLKILQPYLKDIKDAVERGDFEKIYQYLEYYYGALQRFYQLTGNKTEAALAEYKKKDFKERKERFKKEWNESLFEEDKIQMFANLNKSNILTEKGRQTFFNHTKFNINGSDVQSYLSSMKELVRRRMTPQNVLLEKQDKKRCFLGTGAFLYLCIDSLINYYQDLVKKKSTHNVDVYAFAVVLHSILTDLPINDENFQKNLALFGSQVSQDNFYSEKTVQNPEKSQERKTIKCVKHLPLEKFVYRLQDYVYNVADSILFGYSKKSSNLNIDVSNETSNDETTRELNKRRWASPTANPQRKVMQSITPQVTENAATIEQILTLLGL